MCNSGENQNDWKWCVCIVHNVTQHIERYQLSDFELWGCKVKISQNMVPNLILRFHMYFGIFNTESFSYLKDLVQKQVFSCKNGHAELPKYQNFVQTPKFSEAFSQNQVFTSLF